MMKLSASVSGKMLQFFKNVQYLNQVGAYITISILSKHFKYENRLLVLSSFLVMVKQSIYAMSSYSTHVYQLISFHMIIFDKFQKFSTYFQSLCNFIRLFLFFSNHVRLFHFSQILLSRLFPFFSNLVKLIQLHATQCNFMLKEGIVKHK